MAFRNECLCSTMFLCRLKIFTIQIPIQSSYRARASISIFFLVLTPPKHWPVKGSFVFFSGININTSVNIVNNLSCVISEERIELLKFT